MNTLLRLLIHNSVAVCFVFFAVCVLRRLLRSAPRFIPIFYGQRCFCDC